jgi:hypothetical protein
MTNIKKLTESLKSAIGIEDTAIDSVDEFIHFIMNWKDFIEMDQVGDYKNFQDRHRDISPNKSKITVYPYPTQIIHDNSVHLNFQMNTRNSGGRGIAFPETREIRINICGRKIELLEISLIYGYTPPISFTVSIADTFIFQSLYKYIYSIASGRLFCKMLFIDGFEEYKASSFIFRKSNKIAKLSFNHLYKDFVDIYSQCQQDIHNGFEGEIDKYISLKDLIRRKNAHNIILKKVYHLNDFTISSMEKYGNKGIYQKISE